MMNYVTRGFVLTILIALLSVNLFANNANNLTLQDSSKSLQKTEGTLADVYNMPPTIHNELTGKNIPAGLALVSKLSTRVCQGEFEPFSILIQPKVAINNITFSWTDFTGSNGSIPQSALDVSIVKVWYQSGYVSSQTNNKHLTQELLVKNDNIVKVDYGNQSNNLLVTNISDNSQKYINVSDPGATFPNSSVLVKDSPTLLPFSLDGTTNRQIWMTIHVPDNVPAGKYTSQFTINSASGVIQTIPMEIEVLPFKLDQSRLIYSIYYNGYADKWTKVPFTYTTKSPEQYKLEMQDMKDHGVLYPTTYQILQNLDLDLQIRQEVGLPTDRLYTLGLITGNPTATSDLNTLKSNVKAWKDKMAPYGYKDLYVYGIDEARGTELTSQRPAWNAVHEAGAKVFVAGYFETYDAMGDILDNAVIQQELRPDQADKYHSKGNKILSYSNPQVGQENPELYRRNFGLALWKAGYDGAMNYAYQKFYNSEWNDFDNSRYREETFTYETSDGLLKTIEWEGFREGVDDTRYLATLLNKIDALKAQGNDVTALTNWVNSLDITQNMDQVRSQIIDKILTLGGSTMTDVKTTTATPGEYKLNQNFPNPFNPTTKISYSLPQAGQVTLKVYDVLGKEVMTLVNEQKAAGSYEV
ncbi:MAG: hypothetical protein ACM3RX_01240, partial [Methanococcaceae archaeon]